MPNAHSPTALTSTSSSTSTSSPTRIRILSLNVWAIKYISVHRHARLHEIGTRIASSTPPPDIVSLQECFTQADFETIRSTTRHILPYGKFYHSGIFGGGLVILSRWRIEESGVHAYPLNGRPAAFYRGDWYVGKGVASARIRFKEGVGRRGVLEVFNTHLHAPYEREPNDSYLCHRTAQAWTIAKLMRHAHERGHLVIGLGDFNMRPLSLAHRIIETHSRTRDVWRVLKPDSSLGSSTDAAERARGRPVPTAEENLRENGATCDSVLNSWRWPKEVQRKVERERRRGGEDVVVDVGKEDPKAKRLDYIFFSEGEKWDEEREGDIGSGGKVDDRSENGGDGKQKLAWRVTEASVGMTKRHPVLRCSLSDHFSVEAVISLLPVSSSPFSPSSSSTSTSHSSTSSKIPPNFLSPTTYTEILTLISTYTAREVRQGTLRLRHAILQTLLSLGCLVGIFFVPGGWPGFLLALAAALGTGVAVLESLLGGLFVRSEIGALKEFEWEVRNARTMAEKERGREVDL